MMDSRHRDWTVAETHALLDLIRDEGFIPALCRKGFQNWDVFDRLHVLLRRCNIKVSTEEVKRHWCVLKTRFWKRKQMVDAGLGQRSAITVDFIFYDELEQLLLSRKPVTSCKREAESSGLPAPEPSSSDESGGVVDSSSHLEEEGVARPHHTAAAGRGGTLQDLHRLMSLLHSSLQELRDATQQLQHSQRHMLDLFEQVYTREANQPSPANTQQQRQVPEPPCRRTGPRRVRVVRRSLRRSLRSQP